MLTAKKYHQKGKKAFFHAIFRDAIEDLFPCILKSAFYGWYLWLKIAYNAASNYVKYTDKTFNREKETLEKSLYLERDSIGSFTYRTLCKWVKKISSNQIEFFYVKTIKLIFR